MRTNNVDRILVVSFTNHTVDKTLEMLLDSGETSFVRLGGRSKHKRIAEFALEKLEDASRNPPELSVKYRNMRMMSDRLKDIIEKLQNPISEGDMVEWLQNEYPIQYQSLEIPPEHVTSSNRPQNPKPPTSTAGVSSPSLFSWWIKGRDIQLDKAKLTHFQEGFSEEKGQPNHPSKVLDRPSTSGQRDPPLSWNSSVPSKRHQKPARLLADLLVNEDVWMMTTEERRVLLQGWKESATAKLRSSLTASLKRAKEEFETARESWESVRDSVR